MPPRDDAPVPPAALRSAATLRQKKAALLEVIELQRKLIESHDANVSEELSSSGADGGGDKEL